MTLNRIWIPSPCYHSRGGTRVNLIVLHTAEGARTIEDLGHFFQNGNNQVSSHAGADDKRGKIGEYVTRGNAAWTQGGANEEAVSLELCGFASWSRSTWLNSHSNMLHNAADWLAEEAAKLGIPVSELSSGSAQGGGRGVCQHIDLGSWGGSHVDCGSGFPVDQVIAWAKGGSGSGGSAPVDDDEGEDMLLPDIKNCPLAIKNEHRRIRFFCNTAEVTIEVTFVGGPANKSATTSFDRGAQGVDIPDNVTALVIRRGDAPAGGYPPVSYALQA